MLGMIIKLKAITVLAAAGLLCGCPTTPPQYQARPEQEALHGAYIHAGSKILMPETIAGFKRGVIMHYDAHGQDVSAGYNLMTDSSLVAATVYVYPAPSLMSIGSSPDVIAGARSRLAEREFERRKQEIRQVHPGATFIEQHDTVCTEGGQSYAGKVATYEYEELFAGSRRLLRSQLCLFCYVGGKWAVEYRFTRPKAEDADKEIQEFMEKWNWYGAND
jgi:hypothetical protein